MPDYDTDKLDTVQHPDLGTLRFPSDMPPEERNQVIDNEMARMRREGQKGQNADPADEKAMFEQTIHQPSIKPENILRGRAKGKWMQTGDPNAPATLTVADPQMGMGGIDFNPATTTRAQKDEINRDRANKSQIALTAAGGILAPIPTALAIGGSYVGGKLGKGGVQMRNAHRLDELNNKPSLTAQEKAEKYAIENGATQSEEDIGEFGGSLAGGAAGGYAGGKLSLAIDPYVAKGTTAPVRFGARYAESAINSKLSPVKSGLKLFTPADEAVNMNIKVPGRNLGLNTEEGIPYGWSRGTPKAPVRETPFSLTSPDTGSEQAIQSEFGFPKRVVSDEPFQLSSGEGATEAPAQQSIQFPKSEAQIARERAQMMNTVNRMSKGEIPTGNATPFEKPPAPLKRSDLKGIGDEINRQAGSPRQGNVALKDQLQNDMEPRQHRSPIQVANGDKMWQQINSDPKLADDFHALGRVDLRQALVNADIDVGQRVVSDSKYLGEGGIKRVDAINMLLDKGYTPKEIIHLTKHRL